MGCDDGVDPSRPRCTKNLDLQVKNQERVMQGKRGLRYETRSAGLPRKPEVAARDSYGALPR